MADHDSETGEVRPQDVPVRFSELKYMALSPAHYLARVSEEVQDTAQMRMGRAVHQRVLGGREPIVWDGDRRGNAWKAFKAEHEGSEILTVAERDLSMRAADAVMRHSRAAELIEGEHEVPLQWEIAGRACATRGVDVIGKRHVTELKTSFTTAPWRFPNLALRMHYHAQLAWYRDALAQLRAQDFDYGFVVGVEVKAPFAVTVFELTPRTLEAGTKAYRLWLERLLACESSNDWPAYTEAVVPIDVPDDEDFALQIGGESVGFDEDAA